MPPGIPTLGSRLRAAGYHVAYRGKWHLTKPLAGEEWSAADSERMERDYGFDKWDAYMMLSQCGKVRLGNFVDPKYTVGAAISKKFLARP